MMRKRSQAHVSGSECARRCACVCPQLEWGTVPHRSRQVHAVSATAVRSQWHVSCSRRLQPCTPCAAFGCVLLAGMCTVSALQQGGSSYRFPVSTCSGVSRVLRSIVVPIGHTHSSVVMGHLCCRFTRVLSMLQQQEAKLRLGMHVCLAGPCLPCHSMPQDTRCAQTTSDNIHTFAAEGLLCDRVEEALCTVEFELQGSSLCTYLGLCCVQDFYSWGTGREEGKGASARTPVCRHDMLGARQCCM